MMMVIALLKLRLPNPMYESVPNRPLDYYTCPFKSSKLDRSVLKGYNVVFLVILQGVLMDVDIVIRE